MCRIKTKARKRAYQRALYSVLCKKDNKEA